MNQLFLNNVEIILGYIIPRGNYTILFKKQLRQYTVHIVTY